MSPAYFGWSPLLIQPQCGESHLCLVGSQRRTVLWADQPQLLQERVETRRDKTKSIRATGPHPSKRSSFGCKIVSRSALPLLSYVSCVSLLSNEVRNENDHACGMVAATGTSWEIRAQRGCNDGF